MALGAGLVQGLEILRRDDAADDDHDVGAAVLLQLGACSSGTSVRWPAASDETPTMWTSFSTACARRLRRRREQRADIDVEAEIGEGRGDDLLAAVVAVLAHLGDEDARAAAVGLLEGRDHARHARDALSVMPDLPLVDAGDRLDLRAVAAEHLLQRERDLADRRLGARRVDGELQQVAVAAGAPSVSASSAACDVGLVALGLAAA